MDKNRGLIPNADGVCLCECSEERVKINSSLSDYAFCYVRRESVQTTKQKYFYIQRKLP